LVLTKDDFFNAGFTDVKETKVFTEFTNEDIITSKLFDSTNEALLYDLKRVTGWFRNYIKSNGDDLGFIYVTLYESSNSAQKALSEYNSAKLYSDVSLYTEKNFDLGDKNVVSAGKELFMVEFSSRNVKFEILMNTTEIEPVVKIARNILEKVQKAPLVQKADSTTLRSEAPALIDAGIYLVGKDIEPGLYRNLGDSSSCYWKKTDSSGGTIDNFFGMTGGTISISQRDFQIELDSDCGKWIKLK
jgi:hypothetical protein